MPDSGFSFLIFGMVSLFQALYATATGVAWARWGRMIQRAEDPKPFWRLVAAYYLGGIFFIGAEEPFSNRLQVAHLSKRPDS